MGSAGKRKRNNGKSERAGVRGRRDDYYNYHDHDHDHHDDDHHHHHDGNDGNDDDEDGDRKN